MLELNSGIGISEKEKEKEPELSLIQDIQFKFGSSMCIMSITVTDHQPQKFKIKYEESKFQTVMDKPLRDLGLKLLDLISINILYQMKLVDQLLIKCLKRAMVQIHRFSLKKIIDNTVGELKIEALVNQANIEASGIMKEIEEKFTKISGFTDEAQIEVYDRSSLVRKAKEEIIDNLNRKYVLVVNQLIEKQRDRDLPVFPFAGQVDEFINNLL